MMVVLVVVGLAAQSALVKMILILALTRRRDCRLLYTLHRKCLNSPLSPFHPIALSHFILTRAIVIIGRQSMWCFICFLPFWDAGDG